MWQNISGLPFTPLFICVILYPFSLPDQSIIILLLFYVVYSIFILVSVLLKHVATGGDNQNPKAIPKFIYHKERYFY